MRNTRPETMQSTAAAISATRETDDIVRFSTRSNGESGHVHVHIRGDVNPLRLTELVRKGGFHIGGQYDYDMTTRNVSAGDVYLFATDHKRMAF